MRQKDWTKRLYDRLADYEEAAPADLWAGIEAKLAQKSVPKRPSRIVPMWGRWAAAAAVFVGLLIGNGYLMWEVGHEEPTARQTTAAVSKSAGAVIESPSTAVAIEDFVPVQSRQSHRLMAAATNQEQSLVAELGSADAPAMPQTVEASGQQNEVASTTPTQQQPSSSSQTPKAQKTTLPDQREQLRQLDEKIASEMAKRKSMVAYGLYAQNGFVNHVNTNAVMVSPSNAEEYARNNYRTTASTRAGEADIVYLRDYKEQQKHYLPISFGLTANFPISSKLSLTTGLVYTRLRSDFTNTMASNDLLREQTLHYLGIPLTLQYQLWHYGGLNVYVAGGGQADYNFKADLKTAGVAQSIEKDRIQLSVQGGLGVQYDIIPQLAVYIEPGLKYYFDNGSDLRNFFKDTPTNFNLQVGVRLNSKADRIDIQTTDLYVR